MASNRATSWLHLKNVVYVIALCICTSSSGALARNDVLRMWPCPPACNCSQSEGSNRYLALCAGGRAAFEKTVRQLPKDVTNFTFVLQTRKVEAEISLDMSKLGDLINLETLIITSAMQGPFKYSPYNLHWLIKHPCKSKNLTTLQINTHISNIFWGLNCSFATLEKFDLSNSRMEVSSPSAIYHLLKSTSPGRLRVLNFHFSIAATYPFGQLNFSTFFESSKQWDHLEKFDFSQNGVSRLSPGVYHRLPKLKYIDLSNNAIGLRNKDTDIALLELFLHPVLEVINLSNQKAAEIDRLRAKRSFEHQWNACFGRKRVTNTKSLCSLLYCTLLRNLRGYFPCEELLPGIFDFSSQCWLGLYFPIGKNLRELYLSKALNVLYQGLSSDLLLPLKYCVHPNNSIEVLDLSDNYVDHFIGKDNNITEIWLSGLAKLRYLNVQNNKLPFSVSSKCDFPKLEVLLLGGNRMPFHIGQDRLLPNMPLLRILDLANNGIESFPILTFSELFYLQELNLSCNSLTNLDLKLPASREMRLLNVSGNKLTSLPYRFLRQLDNHIASLSVDMTDNPFMCGCDSIDFVKWVQTTKLNLVRRHDYLCYHEHIGQVSIADVDTDALHKTCNPPIVPPAALRSSFGTLLLISLLVGTFFVYRKRWYLRYKWYLIYRCMKRPPQEIDEGEFLYDGFVIYSIEDRQWVNETLREELEGNRNCGLFIYMRDMLGGGALVDRILEGMEQCRKCIMVLSPNFLASNRCLFEAYAAHNNLLARDRDVMVVVKLDALPLAGIPVLITNILNMKECLEWTEDPYGRQLFWDKLEDALRSPPTSFFRT